MNNIFHYLAIKAAVVIEAYHYGNRSAFFLDKKVVNIMLYIDRVKLLSRNVCELFETAIMNILVIYENREWNIETEQGKWVNNGQSKQKLDLSITTQIVSVQINF